MRVPLGYPHATTPPEAYCGFDCSQWHAQCGAAGHVSFIPHGGGSRGGFLWCGKCRIAVDAEACTPRITHAQAEAAP